MSRLTGRARSRGQSLAEFALVLPLIVLVLFGLIDMGRAVYAYNTLAESSRQANRVAIVTQNGETVRSEAKAYAPTLGLADADIDLCFKRSDSLQRDCAAPATDACSPVRQSCLAIVTTRTNFQPITPIISSIVPSIQLRSTSVGPVERTAP